MNTTTKNEPVKVFISYARKDIEYLEELDTRLATLKRNQLIETWDDRKIPTGEDWETEIKKALERCQIAVILISENFLNSDFIASSELPSLLKKRKEAGVKVLPVLITECDWKSHPDIPKIQATPRSGPVQQYEKGTFDRNKLWNEIINAIKTTAESLSKI